MTSFLTSRLTELYKNTQGSIIPMIVFGTLISITVVGIAIDISREQVLRAKLNSSLDAATIAATKFTQYSFICDPPTMTEEECINREVNAVGLRYFNTNFANAFGKSSLTKPSFVYDFTTGSVIGHASVDMPTVLMQVAGFKSLQVSANSVAQASVFYIGADLNHVNPMINADPTTGMYTQPYTYNIVDSSGNNKTITGNAISFSTGDGKTPTQQVSIDASGMAVAGQIQVGIVNMQCTPSIEGAMHYDKTIKCMQYCDGSNWRTMVIQDIQNTP